MDFCYDPKDGDGGGDGGGGSGTVDNKGNEYCDTNECDKCEGDCDSDSQCKGDLRCFFRSGYERVPGCNGSTDKYSKLCIRRKSSLKCEHADTYFLYSLFTEGIDFCYDPKDNDGGGRSSAVNNKGNEYCDTNDCDKCEGDCDSDSQCKGDLRCFFRSGYETVPGCSGSTDQHSKLNAIKKYTHSLQDLILFPQSLFECRGNRLLL